MVKQLRQEVEQLEALVTEVEQRIAAAPTEGAVTEVDDERVPAAEREAPAQGDGKARKTRVSRTIDVVESALNLLDDLGPPINQSQIERQLAMHPALIKSKIILAPALARDDVAQLPVVRKRRSGDAIQWLIDELAVRMDADGSTLELSYQGDENSEEMARLLDAIASTYQETIRQQNQLIEQARFEDLNAVLTGLRDSMNEKRDALRKRYETKGWNDIPAASKLKSAILKYRELIVSFDGKVAELEKKLNDTENSARQDHATQETRRAERRLRDAMLNEKKALEGQLAVAMEKVTALVASPKDAELAEEVEALEHLVQKLEAKIETLRRERREAEAVRRAPDVGVATVEQRYEADQVVREGLHVLAQAPELGLTRRYDGDEAFVRAPAVVHETLAYCLHMARRSERETEIIARRARSGKRSPEQAQRDAEELESIKLEGLATDEKFLQQAIQPDGNPRLTVTYSVAEFDAAAGYQNAAVDVIEGFVKDPYGPRLPITVRKIDDERAEISAPLAIHVCLRLALSPDSPAWRLMKIQREALQAAEEAEERGKVIPATATVEREAARPATDGKAWADGVNLRAQFQPTADNPVWKETYRTTPEFVGFIEAAAKFLHGRRDTPGEPLMFRVDHDGEQTIVTAPRKAHEYFEPLFNAESPTAETPQGPISADLLDSGDVEVARYRGVQNLMHSVRLADLFVAQGYKIRTQHEGSDRGWTITTERPREEAEELTSDAEIAVDTSPSLPERGMEGTPFLSEADQAIADRAYRVLGLEVEPLVPAPEEAELVKPYGGGLRIVGVRAGAYEREVGDMLVGIHTWAVPDLATLGKILDRAELAELSPLKGYVIGLRKLPQTGGMTSQLVTVRLAIDGEALRAAPRFVPGPSSNGPVDPNALSASGPTSNGPVATPARSARDASLTIVLRRDESERVAPYVNGQPVDGDGLEALVADTGQAPANVAVTLAADKSLGFGEVSDAMELLRSLGLRNFKVVMGATERASTPPQGGPGPVAGPYRIQPGDALFVRVLGALPDQPIDGRINVEAEGTLPLGVAYGRVTVAGLTVLEAEVALRKSLSKILTAAEVQVTLLTKAADAPTANASADNEVRYDGKTFDDWVGVWRRELKVERRLEALNAMAAFVRVDPEYTTQAAEAVIEVAGQYADYDVVGDGNPERQLKQRILDVLQSAPTNKWLPMLIDKFTGDARRWESLTRRMIESLQRGQTETETRRLLLQFAGDGTQMINTAALRVLVRTTDRGDDPEVDRFLLSELTSDDPDRVRQVLGVLRFQKIDEYPEQIDVIFHPNNEVRQSVLVPLAEMMNRVNLQAPSIVHDYRRIVDRMVDVLGTSENEADRLHAIQGLTAMTPFLRANSEVDRIVRKQLLEIIKDGSENLVSPAVLAMRQITGSDNAVHEALPFLSDERREMIEKLAPVPRPSRY
jgi:biopolymer transport protein ExbD